MLAVQKKLPGSKSFTITGGKIMVGKRRAGFIKCLNKTQNNALAFITPRKRAAHFFRNYAGYGMNRDLVQYLKERQVKHILIIETTRGFVKTTRYLLSNVDDWLFKSFEVQHSVYEEQFVLPEASMKQVEKCVDA